MECMTDTYSLQANIKKKHKTKKTQTQTEFRVFRQQESNMFKHSQAIFT